VTANDFRRIALSMPEAIEASHMGHPDFRVGKKIFATLGHPDAACGMVKLTPQQQAVLVAAHPKVFVPVPGGWGRSGSTNVRLKAANAAILKSALAMAWRNIAPKALLKNQDGEKPVAKGRATKSAGGNLARAVARMRRVVTKAKLPDIEEGASFGMPGLKVRGKFLMRVKDGDTLVFRCPIEMKEVLIESLPDIYFETDHYNGYSAVLVRLWQASDAELTQCLRRAWLLQAPQKLIAQHQGATAARKAKRS
jgi:hypothetical protein